MASAARTQAACAKSVRDEREAKLWADSTMLEVRQYAREHAAEIQAEWDAITIPPRTIGGHLATLSPERRAELNAEWEQSHD